MQPIYFDVSDTTYGGYTNGHWLFASETKNKIDCKKFDVSQVPLHRILAPQKDLLVFPHMFGNVSLAEKVAQARCVECNGNEFIICAVCRGHGLQICGCGDCGHVHQTKCVACVGHGRIACKKCPPLSLQACYVKINDVIINESVLLDLLRHVPWSSGAIYAHIEANALVCKIGGYIAAVMPIIGQTSWQYEVQLQKHVACVVENHCWHIKDENHELCCHCGFMRNLQQHGAYCPDKAAGTEREDFVF